MLCVYNTAVELLNSDALLTVDIVEMSNIRFLNQQQLLLDDEQDWSFHPYFAAGRIYDHSFAVRYLVQLYFQPDLAEPIEYLTGANPFAQKKHILLQPIPDVLVGEPYAALFDYFTDRDELPLGLYRFHAYVLTNPRRDTVIHADDQVYVVTKSTEMMDRPNVHTFTAP